MNRRIAWICALLFTAGPACADSLLVTLNPGFQLGNPGDELIFGGTITATTDVNANAICVKFNTACDNQTSDVPPSLTLDSNVFFGNLPGFFANGDQYMGPIFGIVIDPNASPGLYTATVTLFGGATQFDITDPIGTDTFQVEVSPEPGTVLLLLPGLCMLAICGRRFRRTRSANQRFSATPQPGR